MPIDNLKRWTAMAEIASAVAVVLSLIYVGYEIRRSTLESDADVQAELLSYSRAQRVLVVENGDLARILTKCYADPADLTPEEALRFNNYVELHFVAWERAFMAGESGVLSGERWTAWDEWFAATANRDPDFIWARVRGTLKYKPFLQHADSALGFTEPRKR
jgi:hypothetical protein